MILFQPETYTTHNSDLGLIKKRISTEKNVFTETINFPIINYDSSTQIIMIRNRLFNDFIGQKSIDTRNNNGLYILV